MKIKLDENLPVELAPVLRASGHDVATVQDEALLGSDDETIWNAVQQENRFFITQDRGFPTGENMFQALTKGSWLSAFTLQLDSQLIAFIQELFQRYKCETWRGCLVTAAARKLRVVAPST